MAKKEVDVEIVVGEGPLLVVSRVYALHPVRRKVKIGDATSPNLHVSWEVRCANLSLIWEAARM